MVGLSQMTFMPSRNIMQGLVILPEIVHELLLTPFFDMCEVSLAG